MVGLHRICRLNIGKLYIYRQEVYRLPVIAYGIFFGKDISQKETQHEIHSENPGFGCTVQRIGM